MRKIEVKDINKLCYYGEHLFWIEGKNLMAISLTRNKTFTLAELDNSDASYLQIGQERIAIVYKDKIEIHLLPSTIKSLVQ